MLLVSVLIHAMFCVHELIWPIYAVLHGIESGGALLSQASIATPDAEKIMVGSTMVMVAESVDELKKIIENDVYYTSRVVSTLITSD